MKTIFTFLFLTFSLFASDTYFTTDPTLSPDGSQIAFCYDNDIWVVNSNGGQAFRLTGMDGRESEPAYSPDGEWIAFTGRQDGNPNVYLMPASGGEIVQLTFHDDNDYVDSWSWDSKYIYFSSSRYNYKSTYKISINGGTPERLFDHYFNWPHNLVEDPKENIVYFNTSWESYNFPMRKRYVGAFNSDIQSYNFDTGEYKKLTTFEGKDTWPTIDRNGNLYFASVQFNNEYNLYKHDENGNIRLTEFDRTIKRPRVSANGSIVVFEKDYQIYKYNVTDGSSQLVDISLFQNNTLSLNKEFNTSSKISSFDVSSDNKKIAFVSRGVLFVSDIEGKFVKRLNTNSSERVVDVFWLSDNETILFTQTVKGWPNIFTIRADDNKEAIQRTHGGASHQSITFNSDKSKAIYLSGSKGLYLLDLKSFASEQLVEDEFWAVYPSTAYFSPDDKYVAYSSYRNFEQDIFIYDLDKKSTRHFTKTGVSETNPYWSPDGKYIYFTADRFNPTYPSGFKDSEIYRIALQNIDDDFKSDEFEKLFTKEEKDTSKPIVKIDYTNIENRWEEIVTFPQNQFGTHVIQENGATYVFYTSNHDNEGWNLWKTTVKPFEKNEHKKIDGAKGNGFNIVEADEKYYVLMGSDIYKLNLSGNKVEKISVDFKFTRNLQSDFTQMYYEAWAKLAENFYDEDYHGVNFTELRDYYAQFLPFVKTRINLRVIMDDLLGELNSSHLGFYSTGDEEKTFYDNKSANTGILFSNNNPFIVERIVNQSPASKGNKDIRKDDKLIAVNGVRIDQTKNRESYFISPSLDEEIELTFERTGSEFSVKIKPLNSSNFEVLLYDEWMDENQKRVDEKSNNRIAYIHMKNMGQGELQRFKKEIADEWHYRDALILDLRYNRGGNVHDEVLQMLSQKSYLQWKYRDGKLTPQPNFAPSDKPIVLLINEQSLSDAEMTAEGFQTLKLGTIIGNETYRWIIFTTNIPLLDGTIFRLPSWGCYTLEGENIEKVGVAPDILVINTFKDRLEGNDPQLDKAIDEILKELK
ncbi:MAG: S41 family peptidase [Melioribacteraceae bacterium]|nr:S41 family peptidase [Melioribacteraceae bacterium]